MTGYNLLGQLVYDQEAVKPEIEDKLEVLFNKMRHLLYRNDMVRIFISLEKEREKRHYFNFLKHEQFSLMTNPKKT